MFKQPASKSFIAGLDDYCIVETFQATCESDEVIIMTHAVYGRMKIGKCVKDELGKILQCVNVLPCNFVAKSEK